MGILSAPGTLEGCGFYANSLKNNRFRLPDLLTTDAISWLTIIEIISGKRCR
ncbi:hypothetical protein [Propionivibrio sp.]|uniref:hypothetical protein n=1 Tax=Propionivibrio sp. TaxID=2212460 RepID=UPI003BF051C7